MLHTHRGSSSAQARPQTSMYQLVRGLTPCAKIGANPFQVKTGNTLKIKLAYMGCLIEAYGYTDLLTPLQSTRHDQPWEGKKGKDIMNKYKESCRTHHNGDMAVAMDRYTSRGRAYTARETN